MHVLVTGAGGFVGSALVKRLLEDAQATPQPLTRLTLIDRPAGAASGGVADSAAHVPSVAATAFTVHDRQNTLASADVADPNAPPTGHRPTAERATGLRLQWLAGDFADPGLLARALSPAPDWVFHLASVPGGLAEREPSLGLQANLLGPIGLLHALAGAANPLDAAGMAGAAVGAQSGLPGSESGSADRLAASSPAAAAGCNSPDRRSGSADRPAPSGSPATAVRRRPAGESNRADPPASRLPRVVFASSVAVYGSPSVADGAVDESMPARPLVSYGAHKLMTEILLADLSRRGRLDGVSLRLPGIVARPESASGHGSAFMSDLLRRLLAGRPYVCPVSAAAQCWWMSLRCCVDNLLHAARLPAAQLAPSRCVQLPVITATVRELVIAIEAATGRPADLRFAPDADLEARFGRQPPLATPLARGLGFTDDGSLRALVDAATALDDRTG